MMTIMRLFWAMVLLLPPILAWPQLQFGPGPSEPGSALDKIVAVVNNDIITRRELDSALSDTRRQLQARGGAAPAPETLQAQVLERLIMAKLQTSAAQREGIVVDDPTLNAAVESIARQNNMDLDQLRQVLQKDGIDYAAFRDDVRKQVLINRLRQKVVDSQITVSEQEVNNALRQFAASGQTAQEYRIGQILIALPEAASPEQIDTARAKGEQILTQLRQGGDFRRIAAAESDGREALDGGEIGWRSAAQLPSLFADAVIRLKPGETTELIRSPAGFHIIKLFEVRREGGTSPAAASQGAASQGAASQGAANFEAVREALFRRKVEEEWELWLRRLRDEAYVEIRLPGNDA